MALPAPLARLDVSLEDDMRAGRHLEIDSDALTSLDPAARQKATQQELVEPFGHRCGRAVGSTGSAPSAAATSKPPAETFATR
jgi:hypothetical protein